MNIANFVKVPVFLMKNISVTITPTPSSTPTPTPTPVCECHDGTINNNGAYSYYDCSGTQIFGAGEQGSTICFDINRTYSGNITDDGISSTCFCT